MPVDHSPEKEDNIRWYTVVKNGKRFKVAIVRKKKRVRKG